MTDHEIRRVTHHNERYLNTEDLLKWLEGLLYYTDKDERAVPVIEKLIDRFKESFK